MSVTPEPTIFDQIAGEFRHTRKWSIEDSLSEPGWTSPDLRHRCAARYDNIPPVPEGVLLPVPVKGRKTTQKRRAAR